MGFKNVIINGLIDQASEGNKRAIRQLDRIAVDYWFKVDGIPLKKWLRKIKIHFHLLNSAKGGDVKLRVGRKLNGNIPELGQGLLREDQGTSCTKGRKRAR